MWRFLLLLGLLIVFIFSEYRFYRVRRDQDSLLWRDSVWYVYSARTDTEQSAVLTAWYILPGLVGLRLHMAQGKRWYILNRAALGDVNYRRLRTALRLGLM
ncbi:MAG: hypothetical protein H0W44_08105 [Gammaproteobacteria bacterium]|nr:hypothetical protein [Gammaproteobacteria bacterium]